MFQRILVPLDGSVLAERALAHARRLAQIFDARIILLHVLDASLYLDNTHITEPFNWQVRKAQAEVYLQSVAARMSETGVQVTYALQEGKAAESIIDFAHTEGVDLLVMTTHGASGLSRWNTSSVTQKVLEKIYLPALLVRAYPPAARQEETAIPTGGETTAGIESAADAAAAGAAAAGSGAAGPATTSAGPSAAAMQSAPPSTGAGPAAAEQAGQASEEINYRRILVPIDTSRRAECALSAAVSLAREDTSLVLAAVIRPPDIPIPAPYSPEATAIIDRFLQVSRDSVNTYLEEQQRRLPAQVVTRVTENENISAALHDLAEEEDVDLVILCAHGQTGGMKWPYGSVSRNYIEHGDRTVLIIQDVPRSQVRPTAVENAARKYGRR